MTKIGTEQFAPPPPQHGEAAASTLEQPAGNPSFSVVGVGASAGGLDAFTQLLRALPPETGMAFVLVQHLAPSHPSALAELLSRATKMPVAEVLDAWVVEPNRVYVIPPGRGMVIAQGTLQLLPREGHGIHRPIDQFFRSLAEDRRHRAIGVVLSGTASDGTLGLEAIKAEGGITFAQDATAQHEGMPDSAIASGCVDFVLPPDEIAREIVRISRHPHVVPEEVAWAKKEKPNLDQVVHLLHRSTGVDFGQYKFNTLYRRITRRMIFCKASGLPDYVKLLEQSPEEAEALYQDILISVTSFFRDPAAFESLARTVFPRLLVDRSRVDPVRIWTLGCSTGQEAYSLAIAFTEAAEAAGSSAFLQLFATDLNAVAIEKARAGVYSRDIADAVSDERLHRFFVEVDGGYRIGKTIRDACVFSRHNVLADPPFSRIDLISWFPHDRQCCFFLQPFCAGGTSQ
jgi:two-component system CheB/CheR fusion protein